MSVRIRSRDWTAEKPSRRLVKIKAYAKGGLADCFPHKEWVLSAKGEEKAGVLHFRIHHHDRAEIHPLTLDESETACSWNNTEPDTCLPWVGAATVCIGFAKFHAKAEQYDRLAIFHLQTRDEEAAHLRSIRVAADGHIEMVVACNALEPPHKTQEIMIAGRKRAAKAFVATTPEQVIRIMAADPMMHFSISDDLALKGAAGVPRPESFGLAIKPSYSRTCVSDMFVESVKVVLAASLERSDPATNLSVGLAVHTGKWSLEVWDDRELTLALGEDCDDMTIRAIAIEEAYRRAAPRLRQFVLPTLSAKGRALAEELLNTVTRYRVVFCQGFASPPHPLDKPGDVIGHVYGLLISRGMPPPGIDEPLSAPMQWERVLNIEPDTLVKTTTEELRRLWDSPAIIEATSASRARPAPEGKPFPHHPTVVSLRTEEGDASYRSVNMMLLDDRAYYFFSEPKPTKFVGGIKPFDLVRPEGETGTTGTDPKHDKTVWILMKKADPDHKHGPDAEQGCIEACLTQQERVYMHYHAIMDKVRTKFAPPSAAPTAPPDAGPQPLEQSPAAQFKGPHYRTTAQYFTGGKFKQVCY